MNVNRALSIATRMPHVGTRMDLFYALVTKVILEMVQSVKVNLFLWSSCKVERARTEEKVLYMLIRDL